MINKGTIKKANVFIIVILSMIFARFNSVNLNAATLPEIKPTVTVSGSALTSNTITVIGSLNNLYAGASYNVATLTEFKTQLGAAIASCADSVTLNYTGSTAFTGYPTSLGSIISDVTQTAGNDYEKLLLKSWSYSYTTPATPGFTVTYKFTYWETADQRSQVTSQVNTIIASIINPGMTDEQKEKAINDYICANVAYDTTLAQHSAYAALFGNKKTVCQGYALLAYKMLTTAGLNARTVVGKANNVGHAWNMVEIHDANGQNPTWYDLDTTWNDPVPDVPGRIGYTYFNVTDNVLIQQKHTWDASFYPAANTQYVTTDPQILTGGRILQSTVGTVTVSNNVDIAPSITFKDLPNKAVVKVYDQNGKIVATKTASISSNTTASAIDVTLALPLKFLDKTTGGEIDVTVKYDNQVESSKTPISYTAAAKTSELNLNAMLITNNAIMVTGLEEKDIISIYESDPTAGDVKPITNSKVSKGNTYIFTTFKTKKATLYITKRSYNQLESDPLAVTL